MFIQGQDGVCKCLLKTAEQKERIKHKKCYLPKIIKLKPLQNMVTNENKTEANKYLFYQ